jgi:hypothetical protein
MMNPYSAEERQNTMLACVYKATQEQFSHLSVRQVIDPPVDMLDAKLARQIAIHILNVEFDIPRRRLVAHLKLARSTILFAIRTVDYRREEPAFDRAYRRIAARAKDLFIKVIRKAAA